ncbi:MAG: FemAB, partial [Sphingobium phenoxybenzoativorans]
LAARAERSNEYLYFRLMTSARERGCRIFDFGRSKVGTGPAAWKKTWGFEGVPLSYALRAADGQALRDVNPLSPQYRRKVEMWKKLPLPVANLVGPWLARGLG